MIGLLPFVARELALLWQIIGFIGETGFPNQIFNDSRAGGFWRADQW